MIAGSAFSSSTRGASPASASKALIPGDILEQVAKGEVTGQKPQDFGLDKNRRLTDEVDDPVLGKVRRPATWV